MQRPATIRHRTSLFDDAVAIVESEFSGDLSLDDIARRVASSRRQLQRAYAEIGETTFREHLTAVRMDRAADMLRVRGLTVREVAHRVGYRQPAQSPRPSAATTGRRRPTSAPARGSAPAPPATRSPGPAGWRTPRRPPPSAGAQRRRASRARPSSGRGPRATDPVCVASARLVRVAPWRGGTRGSPAPASCGRRVSRSSASAIGIALGLWINWFPVARLEPGPQDRHALRRPRRRVGPDLRRRRHRRPLLGQDVPPAAGREGLDGPPIHGDTRLEIVWVTVPALILVGLCTYAAIVLHDIEKAPAASGRPERKVDVYGQQFAWTFQYKQAAGSSRRRSSTCPRAAPCASPCTPRTSSTTSGCRPADEGRRGARRQTRAIASRRSASASSRWSALSCAGSATPTCAAPRTSCPSAPSTRGWTSGWAPAPARPGPTR